MYKAHPLDANYSLLGLQKRLEKLPVERWDYAKEAAYVLGRSQLDEADPLLTNLCMSFVKHFGVCPSVSGANGENFSGLPLKNLVAGLQFIIDLAMSRPELLPSSVPKDLRTPTSLSVLERCIYSRLPFTAETQCISFFQLTVALGNFTFRAARNAPKQTCPFRLPHAFVFRLLMKIYCAVVERGALCSAAFASNFPGTSCALEGSTVSSLSAPGFALLCDVEHIRQSAGQRTGGSVWRPLYKATLTALSQNVHQIPRTTQVLRALEWVVSHDATATQGNTDAIDSVAKLCFAQVFERVCKQQPLEHCYRLATTLLFSLKRSVLKRMLTSICFGFSLYFAKKRRTERKRLI